MTTIEEKTTKYVNNDSFPIKMNIRKMSKKTRQMIVQIKKTIAFSFRKKKRGADRSASLLSYRDSGYTERLATPNRPKQAQATETANRMFSGYIVNRPMTDLHTESNSKSSIGTAHTIRLNDLLRYF